MRNPKVASLAAFTGALCLLAMGCGPSPSAVCAKLEELKALPVGGKTGCEIKWDRARSENKDAYKKEAECVLAATSREEVSKCK
jgi:hypothetical protein